jgi:hypothetical protein
MRRHIRWIRIAAVSLVAVLVLGCNPGGGGSTGGPDAPAPAATPGGGGIDY